MTTPTAEFGQHSHGPCGWPPPQPPCCPCWDEASPEDKAWAGQVAAYVLWKLTAMRYGLCQVTARPCGRRCDGFTTYRGPVFAQGGFAPHLESGVWVNSACGCESPCSCCEVCDLELPGPIEEVVRVTVDGIVQPPDSYRVDNHRSLVRADGWECWPMCQDLDALPTQPGTFAVTYLRGIPLPAMGLLAYGVYACELVKLCCDDKTCRLPRNVRTVARQGVTIEMLDPHDFLTKARTGIPEVDMWLGVENPHGYRQTSAVYSPDTMPPRMTTWNGTATGAGP
jgi:hypothetical protein